MIALSWYILKVLIVSAILCGYYYIALKDKVFHKWNRFYLLSTILLSITLPLISIPIYPEAVHQGVAIKVLQSFTMQDEIVIVAGRPASIITTESILSIIYILISSALLISFLQSLVRIQHLKRRYPHSLINGIHFVNTNSAGTPFSFFNSIFWNSSIDLNTSPGQQIFNHELAHINEKHTYDKIFMNLVLMAFWINPFFWLIKKELHIIHEFAADHLSLKDGDTQAFAEMVLSSVYSKKQFSFTNHFFHSPIKRRLMMLKKSKNAKVSYISRLLVLPIASLIFIGISCKVKSNSESAQQNDTSAVNAMQGQTGSSSNDSASVIPNLNKKVASLKVMTPGGEPIVDVKYEDGTEEKMTIEEAKKRGLNVPPPPPPPSIVSIKVTDTKPQFVDLKFSDGSKERITLEVAKIRGIAIPPSPPTPPTPKIQFTPPKVIKDEKVEFTPPKRVYTKVEKEATFPGGKDAWEKYIRSAIEKSLPEFTDKDFGTCVVRFIVDKDGTVSDVEATTMQGTNLAKFSVDAIRKGPKWKAATVDGKRVNAYRMQPVTLKNPHQ